MKRSDATHGLGPMIDSNKQTNKQTNKRINQQTNNNFRFTVSPDLKV